MKKKEKFEHFDCHNCGKTYLTHDALEQHSQREHGYDWIISASREEVKRGRDCKHNWVPDFTAFGIGKRCTNCSWCML